MNKIELLEHKSASYSPRTYHNATADLTLAIAVDFTTAGERLTKKAAGHKLLACDYSEEYIDVARKLYTQCKKRNVKSLNIAGNGIYTFSKYGHTQEDVNAYLYSILSLVHQHYPIEKIVSGGQTGVDLAGLVAACKLGIPATGMWPKGYKMRFEDGVDVNMDKEDILKMIVDYAEELE